MDEIEENGFTVDLVTVEVGACGFIRYESFCCMNELFGASRRDLFYLLVEEAKVTIKNSFCIWTQRNCWSDSDENSNTCTV